MISKELSLKTIITRNKRLNLATTPINNTKICSNAVEMERNAFGVVIVSVEKNDLIALESVLLKRISEECLTMFNADGSMRKTAKSKLLRSFSYVSLVDMGFASPTSDDRDAKTRNGTDKLWRDYLNHYSHQR